MKIAGCSRDRGGVWRHGATKTHAGSLVSSWYIAKDVLDIAERALRLLEEMRTFPVLRTTGFTRDCDALLKEVDAIYPDQAHRVEDKKSGIQWRGKAVEDLTPAEKQAMMGYCDKHPVFSMPIQTCKQTVRDKVEATQAKDKILIHAAPCVGEALLILADEIDKLRG